MQFVDKILFQIKTEIEKLGIDDCMGMGSASSLKGKSMYPDSSITYRNGYILNKKGEIIGNYANGHIFDKGRNIKGFYSNGFIYDKNHNIICNYNNGFVTFKEK